MFVILAEPRSAWKNLFRNSGGKSLPEYQTSPDAVLPLICVPATGEPGAPTSANVGAPLLNVGVTICPAASRPYARPGRRCMKRGIPAGICFVASQGFGK